jgi:hypothetical protein
LNTIKVAVEVYLQERRRMVSWPAGRLGVHPFKAQLFQIELLDESIDNPDRVLPGYLVFQPARE